MIFISVLTILHRASGFQIKIMGHTEKQEKKQQAVKRHKQSTEPDLCDPDVRTLKRILNNHYQYV